MSRNNKDKYEGHVPRRTHTIMSLEDVASGKKTHWPELEITGPICNLSPELWKLRHLTSLYLNDNNLAHIPSEICRLQCLKHLDLSSNKLHYLPAEIGDMVMLRELLLNNNYLRMLPFALGKLFRLQNLGLKNNPLSPMIVQRYQEVNGTQKLLTYLLDNLAINYSQPPPRPWITLNQPNRTNPVCSFRVMCYNVLCDKYATRQMYGYCPNWALNWEYRRKGIMDEIRHYMADVISLQEVETEQFYNMFLPELKKDGYDGIFSPKSRAKTMGEHDRKYVDGCAIFYKTNKFRLIKEYLVEFTQLAIAIAEGSDNMLNRVMIRDNIGLVALLETKEGAWENGLPADPASIHQPLLVCTAHIHWDPEYCDVKLIQTMMLMSEIQNIVEESARSFRPGSKKFDPSLMPLLLCGDFNSLPNSGVIDFLTSGSISGTHPDFKELAYESCLKKLSSIDKPNEYTHCFKISKAYSNNIMPFTNFTFDFKGIIDYILHSEQNLVPLGILGPLDDEWMKENKVIGCPHPHIPSDHFPLVVAFEMAPTHISLANGLALRR
ncbi:CCR4-NOT transcription complex subunit 6-like, variant 2 [Chamberlinius hualienensis]